jgi:hypothetical protein
VFITPIVLNTVQFIRQHVSITNSQSLQDIAEILLKLALNTNQSITSLVCSNFVYSVHYAYRFKYRCRTPGHADLMKCFGNICRIKYSYEHGLAGRKLMYLNLLRRSDVRDLGNIVSDLYIRLFAFNYQSV